MIASREKFVRGRRARKPRPHVPIEPCLLLMWIVSCHEWPEAVRTDVARNDQEIARRDVRQEPVLIAESNNSHVA